MDTGEPYDTYEVARHADDEIRSKIQLNAEVEVWDVMGTKVITRVK
jgi:translation elongation factor P/translation initiation factor 5A